MKRAIIIVIDSMGIGAMPDCEEFGDVKECNTLKNVCKFNGGLDVPVLEAIFKKLIEIGILADPESTYALPQKKKKLA